MPAPAAAGGFNLCDGDCDGDGTVSVDEIVVGINIALGLQALATCAAMDGNGDLEVSVDELLRAVQDLLEGCAAATVTATAPATATESPAAVTSTPTAMPEDTATATITVTPSVTATPVIAPTALVARLETDLVVLSWINADPATGHAAARLLRRLNAPVAGPDAVVVYSGADNEAGDEVRDLLPDVEESPRTYHYAVYACTPDGVCATVPSATTLTPTLPDVLRVGGYVLHWRHADADVCSDQFCGGTAANPVVPDWWRTCAADCPGPVLPDACPMHSGAAMARQINDAGRVHATAIGEAFDALAIPVGRVVTSEFCRNFQTAELFDFGPAYELNQDITFFVYDEAGRCAASFALLAEVPAPGSNTALIGHSGNDCPPLNTLAWSEAAVYKPDGAGGTAFITRMTWDEWGAFLP